MPTKVVSMKCSHPREGLDVIDAQASAAHRYANRLIELHREFAAARAAALARCCPALEPAEQRVAVAEKALEDLRAAVSARNAAARSRTATAEDRARVADARAELKAARAARTAARAEARTSAEYQSALAQLVTEYTGTLPDEEGATRRTGGKFKEARAACGVYPGTYLRVEAAVEKAVEDAGPNPVRFRRWDGSARVGPQLTPPLTVAAALACEDTRLRLERVPDARTGRNRSERLLAWVRVASDGRAPVWVKVLCHLSRGQLPADALIAWATLVRRQVGTRRHKHPTIPEGVYLPYYEWQLQLTIRTTAEKERGSAGRCAVNLGWHTQGDGTVLVATAVDDAGAVRRLELPRALFARFERVRDLQEIRDRYFNSARLNLGTWLEAAPVPDWMRERAAHLSQWKSLRRLAALYGFWSANRFAGDEGAFAALREWRDRDAHLEQYQLGLHRGAVRRRLSLYRQFAAGLRKRYATVLVDDSDYRELKRAPRPEENESENATAKRHAQIASPGELRQCLVDGGAVKVSAADITRTCHGCGTTNVIDHAHRAHTCSECGTTWDRDENAARNMLASAAAVTENPGTARGPDDPAAPEVAPEPEQADGRWARRKADRSRKRVEGGAAT